MRIPEIRDEVHELATALTGIAARLHVLAEETRRRRFGRAAKTSEPITDEMRTAVFEAYYDTPDATMQAIGEGLNINQGRISEILNGFRR